jgi:drug/metabolite transporter (DMT)-like permease
MVALSWAAALVACLGYGVGSVLQSIGARRTAHVAGVTGAALIVLQLPYLLGLACDALAFLANVVALQGLPLFLVQSVVTASVGVTAVIASILGDRLSRRSWMSLGVLGAGLVLLSLTADAESAARVSTVSQWIILASMVVPVGVGLAGLRLPDRSSALVLATASGLAWTAVAVASRGISADRIDLALLGRPLVWTTVVQGVIGAVFFALALQRGSVTSVSATTFVLEMVIPSAIGLLLFDDSVEHGTGPVALLGFALAIGGIVSLMRFADDGRSKALS